MDVKGNGSTVVRQFPSSGTLPRGGTVTLYTEEGLADEMVTVPEVTGRDMASVEQALAAAGLNLRTVSYTHLDVYKRQEESRKALGTRRGPSPLSPSRPCGRGRRPGERRAFEKRLRCV